TPTIGSANIAVTTGDPSVLRINEWLADGKRFTSDDFIELYNASSAPIDLGGMYVSDVPDGWPERHQMTQLSFIAANGFAVLLADGNTESGANHTSFSISANRDSIALYDRHLNLVDQVEVMPQSTDISQGLSPDGSLHYAYFSLPTPALPNVDNPAAGALLQSLRITEVMYNPAGTEETEEFIELRNMGGVGLDISGVRLRSGIEFDFPNMVLGAGEFVVVVADMAAFTARYGTGINVAGQFSGSLSNGGEQITLKLPNPLDLDILRFDYNDNPLNGWPGEADGNGPSLVVVDTEGDYDDPTNWQASIAVGGTPGRDGRTALGDFDLDGLLDRDDVDLLVQTIIAGTNNVEFELTGNFVVDQADLNFWVTELYGTLMADANLDGGVDGSDFNIWNAHKFTAQNRWTAGDFNADGVVDGSDFNLWSQNRFMSAQPAATASATPRSPLNDLSVTDRALAELDLGNDPAEIRVESPDSRPLNQGGAPTASVPKTVLFGRTSVHARQNRVESTARRRAGKASQSQPSEGLLDSLFADWHGER
ncbi:MAG: lamin tail domain-containing protein, partial [Planctomycetales bacterium]|nr:lamin tail domain-containing protein [Planctomycetales bacterium]